MEKKSQTEIVYEYIKNAIINKVYFPGNRLIEEEIVRETGVSRTSVRAALNQLRYEGIVDGTPNRGMMVTRFHASDIRDVYAVRETLEVAAFSRAIHHITPAGIENMRRANDSLSRVLENFSIIEYVKYNRAVHWEIASASQNRYYQKYLAEIYNTIAVCLLFYNNSFNDHRSIQYHSDLIAALENKDLEAGKKAIIADNSLALEDSSFSD